MNVAELEKAISVLSPEELRKFRSWFAKFDADQGDRQIEQDSNAGKLDHLIENALKDHRAGRTHELWTFHRLKLLVLPRAVAGRYPVKS